PELRAEVGLAPDAEAEEVIEGTAQDLRVAVQLRHRHRPPALLDRHLRRAGQAELLRDDGLGQAEELPRLGNPLTDFSVRLHMARIPAMIGAGRRFCQRARGGVRWADWQRFCCRSWDFGGRPRRDGSILLRPPDGPGMS